MTDIYGSIAHLYLKAGWAPLPLPPGQKESPPRGWTGRDGAWPSGADVQAWREDRPRANIAIRLPLGVIGLDFDAAGLREELEERYGQLPATWSCGNRDGEPWRRIWFYRAPGEFTSPAPKLDIIQFHHRYAVVFPSLHPSGRRYGWLDPAGDQAWIPPKVDDLTALPAPWRAMQRPERAAAALGEFTGQMGIELARTRYSEQITRVREAPDGSMNNELNNAALRIGQLLGQHFSRAEAESDLMLAAAEYIRWRGARRAEDTIRSGLDAGQRQPIEVTEGGFTVNGSAEVALAGQSPKDTAPTATGGTADDASAADRFKITLLSGIEAEEIEWLWNGWIPRRGVTVLYGEGGIGKSTYLAHLAGRITRGTASGALEGLPGKVIVMASEDHYGSVIVPRWAAAGVQLDMVGRIDPVDESGGRLVLPRDTPELRRLIEGFESVAVIFDPMKSFMHSDLSADKEQHVRAVIDPLNAMAQDIGVSFLCLHHINKASSMNSKQRLAGSHAWVDSARAAIAFSKTQEGEYVFSQPKNNYGPMKRPMRYEIVQKEIEITGKTFPASEFVFQEKIEIDMADLFGGQQAQGRGRPPSLDTVAIKGAMMQLGEATVAEMHERFNLLSYDQVRMALTRLAARGEIESLGRGKYRA